MVDPEGLGPRLFSQKVPEGKTAKNRMHLDVNVSAADNASAADRDWSKVTAHAQKLVSAGATLVEERQDDRAAG